MKVVIDTNILLVSISRKSPYNWIFQSLLQGKFELCLTTEILIEYAEVISNHMGVEVADAALHAILNLPNVHRLQIYFNWNYLTDQDDNKFVDCAVAGNANFIVTHDNGFKQLAQVDFPKVEVIDSEKFKAILGLAN